MSEEIRKTGTEINEAELAGVSGGFDQAALNKAKLICAACKEADAEACDGGDATRVAELFSPISDYTHCPYYSKPVG